MKNNRKIRTLRSSIYSLLLIFTMLFAGFFEGYAQRKERTRLKVYYEKLVNGQKKISIVLMQGRGRDMKGVEYGELTLTTFDLDSAIELATLTTDTVGAATLYIENDYKFPFNEDSVSVVEVKFNGNDSLSSSDKQIEFRDLNLELNTKIEDSVKYLNVSAFVIGIDGSKKPVEDLGLKVGVKRLYSNLFLGEVETDEDGLGSFEFPDDIPGDAEGNITLVVKLEDNEAFGTVTHTTPAEWGVPVDYTITSTGRSLYGDSAPLWMIISVAVILGGAWVHFLWAVINVFKIKKHT